jgi:hypothetical protein
MVLRGELEQNVHPFVHPRGRHILLFKNKFRASQFCFNISLFYLLKNLTCVYPYLGCLPHLGAWRGSRVPQCPRDASESIEAVLAAHRHRRGPFQVPIG